MAEGVSTTKEHVVSLTVMRLTRPALTGGRPLYLETDAALVKSQLAINGDASTTGVSLMLPQSFETIYLGETFTFYMCLHNDGEAHASQVCVKADLQTSTQRVSLPNTFSDALHSLEPSKHLGAVVSHEIKDVGQHILVCAVSYVTPAGEALNFRKFYKFAVSKPLDVRTKFYNAQWNDVYFEAQVENLTHQPIVVERVTMDSDALYDCTPIACLVETDDNPSFLAPSHVRQYLFRLRGRSAVEADYKGVTTIGKLDMVWRSSMGERGRLQTCPLQRIAPGCGDVRLTITSLPDSAHLHDLVHVHCTITNCSDREVHLLIRLEEGHSEGLVWCNNVCGSMLPRLPARGSTECRLSLLPTSPGLHPIAGIRLVDTLSQRTYECDDAATLLVMA